MLKICYILPPVMSIVYQGHRDRIYNRKIIKKKKVIIMVIIKCTFKKNNLIPIILWNFANISSPKIVYTNNNILYYYERRTIR